MPQVKKARLHIRRVGRQLLLTVGFWLLVALVIGFTIENSAIRAWCLVFSGVAALVLFGFVERKLNITFNCPDCGGIVEPPLKTKGNGSEPILRLCPSCDVLWHVGHTPSTD